jgi:hypothetical protein
MSPTRSLQAAKAEQETSLLSGRSSGPLSTKGNAEAIEDGQGLFAQCCKCFALLPNKFFLKKNSATKSASQHLDQVQFSCHMFLDEKLFPADPPNAAILETSSPFHGY